MKYKPLLLSPLGLIPIGLPHADAADLKLPVKAAPAITYTPSWAGWYAGVNLGVISDHSSGTGYIPSGAAPGFGYCFGGGDFTCSSSNSQTAVGILGGLQIGYNFQFNKVVLGVETDFDLSSARKTTSAPNNTYAFIGNWTAKTGVNALGTVRGRLGYSFDNILVYGTGGLAYAQMVNTFQAGSGGTGGYSWSGTGWRAGWTAGGGLEYLFNPKWSIKGEALYYDLGTVDHVMTGSIGTLHGLHDRMTGWVARAGINYFFH